MNSLLNRRQWAAAAAALLSTRHLVHASAGPAFKGPLGAELYTVRNIINQDPDKVIARIAEIGYTEAEPGRATLDQLAPVLAKYKIKPVSCHLEADLVVGGKPGVTLPQAIDDAKARGVQHLIFPYLAPAKRGGVDEMKKFADQMNEAGAKITAAGLQFGYHNHAFEFGGKPGERPIDVFVERFDPKMVRFQLDVFWISVAGNDPVEWIGKLGKRVLSVHLKDKNPEQGVLYGEGVKKETFKEVGNGNLNFPAILKASKAAGVSHYFVEQDQTPNPLDSLAQSYRFLRS